MPDDRDVLKRRPTPPHVRAQTAPETWEASEHVTRPGEPSEETLLRRTKHISEAVTDVGPRLKTLEDGQLKLETGHVVLATKLGELELAVARGDGKLDALLEIGAESAREREARRAHDLAEKKLAARVRIIAAIVGIPVGLAALVKAAALLVEALQ